MDKKRILQVADMIEVSETFTMTCEAKAEFQGSQHTGEVRITRCGTPGCVIGHANMARLNDEGLLGKPFYNDLIDYANARDWLQLSDDEAEQMFYPTYWARSGAYEAKDVAAGLRKFAETGDMKALNYPYNVEWMED